MRAWFIGASAAVSILACSATADTYRFDVVDPDARINGAPLANGSYTFFLERTPTPIPGSATPLYFVVPTTEFYTIAGGGSETQDDRVAFFTSAFFGGFQTMFSQYESEQLFTGPTDEPTFRTGTFALKNGRSGATLTISGGAAVTGVPELGTWMMMVGGLGAVGVTLRTRGAVAPKPGARLAPRRARL